jgi:hypothetical protein
MVLGMCERATADAGIAAGADCCVELHLPHLTPVGVLRMQMWADTVMADVCCMQQRPDTVGATSAPSCVRQCTALIFGLLMCAANGRAAPNLRRATCTARTLINQRFMAQHADDNNID